jgi:hypothetical protein
MRVIDQKIFLDARAASNEQIAVGGTCGSLPALPPGGAERRRADAHEDERPARDPRVSSSSQSRLMV